MAFRVIIIVPSGKIRGVHEVVRHGGGGNHQGPDYGGERLFLDDTYWHNGQTQKVQGLLFTTSFFSKPLDFIEGKTRTTLFSVFIRYPNAPTWTIESKEYLDMYKNVKGLGEQYQTVLRVITIYRRQF